MGDNQIRGSRLRRAASMTGTAAGIAAREATARAMRVGGSEGRQAAASRRQLKSAESLVKVLSGMRGAAMKIGQTLSAVDLGLVPEEIRERITQELDYELEASNHHAMARAYRGHPFIVVPDVVSSLCRERVLVSELVEGHRFGEVRSWPADQRNRTT